MRNLGTRDPDGWIGNKYLLGVEKQLVFYILYMESEFQG